MNRKFFSCIAVLFSMGLAVQAQENNYGVEEANTKFQSKDGILGGRTDYDYLALKNHPDVSGVPLGGIGAGNVNFSPSGRFTRIGINNIHMPIKQTEACFFALWTKTGEGTSAVRLVRDEGKQFGMDGVENTAYSGLFPTATMDFAGNGLAVTPKIKAYSSLVPHDVKNSSLPVAWFEVELAADRDMEVAVAFSWEDFIGLYRDPLSLEGIDNGQLLSGDRSLYVNGELWPLKEKAATSAGTYSDKTLQGIMQHSDKPVRPLKMTFQNYVDHVLVAAEKASGQSISCLPSFDTGNDSGAWKGFIENGTFTAAGQDTELTPEKAKSRASAVAVKTKLKKGQKKTVRFALAWWAPEITIPEDAPEGSYWPYGADYNKYYHNYFGSIEELVRYASSNRKGLLEKTLAWHKPVMESTLPDWYKFKLINSGYVIYTNMILSKAGDVTVNEGAMGGFAGTMDQRISSHPFYQKFFTQLDRSEMDIFADAKDEEKGYILHFIGHYYAGMGKVGGRVPTEKGYMLDNSSGWLIQLVKDYEQTGDMEYLKAHVDDARKVMEFLKSQRPEGCQIPVGPTTYDDFQHPPLYSYYAGVWLATLKAYEAMGEAIDDEAMADEARTLFADAQKEAIKKLWNGSFFSYGSEPDGSKRLDCVLFTGQLAGQFLSRYCGWGDVYPMEIVKASIISQFLISLSKTPDYYANKVWDINLGRGIDNPGSQCWPFYLESYTGLAGMQAGFYEDAMDIMKHIQLVHLRQGWTWTQNLWNPSDITYMTAPVTWFSTDVLAGAGLNVPKKELRLSPVVKGNEKTVLPLFYPKFWATLTADPSDRTLRLEITQTFGEDKVSIEKILSQPAGKATSEGREIAIREFVAEKGKVLDLSEYWDEIVASELEAPVLPNADSVPMRKVELKDLDIFAR